MVEAMLAVADEDVKVLGNILPTLPKHIKTVPDAVATMLIARELGLSPMSSFADLFVVNGTVGFTSKLMLALVHRAGHRIDVNATDTTATATCHRRYDGEWQQVGEFTFTKKDAERANLWAKETYQMYPSDMLANKAVARAVRFAFPDVLLGYIPEEIEEMHNVELDVDATFEEEPMSLPEIVEALDAEVVDD